MVGIIVTLLAVLAVICFAFCYSDHQSARGARNDALFYLAPKYLKRNTAGVERKIPPQP